MNDDDLIPPSAWGELAECITRWTGFHPSAIWSRSVHSALQPLLGEGLSLGDVVALARRDDPAIRHRLTQAVPVGESFFFRVPEQFEFVRSTLAPAWAAEPGRVRSIWSAGCASGEEAYSLAATLRAAGVESWQILGTDLVEANIAMARAGRFGPWSLRSGAALPVDPFLPSSSRGMREVDPDLRARTRFQIHNLLDPPPEPRRFDLVFCRNVLIYFTPEAARHVCASLASALAPGGVVAFGVVDVVSAPPQLARIGPPELQLFQRPLLGARPAAPTRPASRARGGGEKPRRARLARREGATPASGPAAPASDPVSLHLSALAHIERGEHAQARAFLAELQRLAPSYLPGMLEEALLCAREGRRANASAIMRSILELTVSLPAEQPIAGPETLPASYYAAAAQSFLSAEVRR